MKEYYSIGEISALLGLSSHTLRYYDKIKLIEPAVVNERTGYRFYSYGQLFTLDMVRHLQLLGFSLDDIRDVLQNGTPDALTGHLLKKKTELEGELQRLSALRDTVDCYLDYYGRADNGLAPGCPYVSEEKPRYVFTEPYEPGEAVIGTAGYRVMVRKSRADCRDLFFIKRAGFILDGGALLAGRIAPTHYYVFLEKPPKARFPEVRELPAGRWLSFRCRALTPEADLSPLLQLLSGVQGTGLAVANERENSIDDSISAFARCMFEVQVLLSPLGP